MIIKQTIATSIPLINITNNHEPLIYIKHTSITLINIKTMINH